MGYGITARQIAVTSPDLFQGQGSIEIPAGRCLTTYPRPRLQLRERERERERERKRERERERGRFQIIAMLNILY